LPEGSMRPEGEAIQLMFLQTAPGPLMGERARTDSKISRLRVV
jgi:hypothetical protein